MDKVPLHDSASKIAAAAIGHIRRHQLSARPENFRIFYSYVSGTRPSLNQIIDARVQAKGCLTDDDLRHLYATFFLIPDVDDRAKEAGTEVIDRIADVRCTVEDAESVAARFRTEAAEKPGSVDAARSHASVGLVLKSLLDTSHEMESCNRELENSLLTSLEEINRLRTSLNDISQEARFDPVTRLTSRRYFFKAMLTQIARARDSQGLLSLAMIDIDHFKQFNDAHGHMAGDQVLRIVADTVKSHTRDHDFVGRLGGEEFAIIFPNVKLEQAYSLASSVRKAIANISFKSRRNLEMLGRVTVSIGVAEFHASETAESLLERADRALYAAKQKGRNCVASEGVVPLAPGSDVHSTKVGGAPNDKPF